MIPNLLYNGCGLCYHQEYDEQIRDDVIDMKKEDRAIQEWRSRNNNNNHRPSSLSSVSSRRYRSKRTRFADNNEEEDGEEYSSSQQQQQYSAQTTASPSSCRVRSTRKHGRGRCWDASTVSASTRQIQAEKNLLHRNLRAAQKELLAQDKMIVQLESDLQVFEMEHSKLEDKMYLMQLDLEDAQTALRREVLRNQENERLLQEYKRAEAMKQEQEQEQRQDEDNSWFGLWY
ncbi:unnamed protein product [Cylindrotheca closterium]|uniref:Uncharacterized protein n=1 Tax=Cylindrotheca closterium TaxID=2856 RepID=A0AAD2CQ08_9STRA|nr:unnamed protein product [Cylindrotheca closterium]